MKVLSFIISSPWLKDTPDIQVDIPQMTDETAGISKTINPNFTLGVDWWELSELTV